MLLGLGILSLGLFFRVRANNGNKTAYSAVARNMLTVAWHLLTNGEKHVEEWFSKVAISVTAGYAGQTPLETMVEVLRNTGYTVVANG